MQNLWRLALASWLFFSSSLVGQARPLPVNFIQLISAPEKFDDKIVAVRGYLVVAGRPNDIVAFILFLSREDAQNNLGNSIVVTSNDQMIKDKEKIDGMYVTLVGRVRVVRAADDSETAVIKDVVTCTVWSDPAHPIGVKQGVVSPN